MKVVRKFVEARAAELDQWEECKEVVMRARAKDERKKAIANLTDRTRTERKNIELTFLNKVAKNDNGFWTMVDGQTRQGKEAQYKEKSRHISRHC